MTEASSVTNDDRERRSLFQDVWGDVPDQRSPRRPAERPNDIALEERLGASSPSARIDELERQVERLQQSVDALRGMTEDSFREIRTAMIRLAEAVQVATRHPAPTREA